MQLAKQEWTDIWIVEPYYKGIYITPLVVA